MAGLDVFVFDDLDNSKSFNSTSDSPLREKAIFIDLNQDGSWNSSEPWTVTDVNGIARFQDLSAGQYTVRLVGSNSKILQTFPAPAEPINWSGTIGRVVRVEPNGSAWTVAGNSLSLFDSSLSNRLRSIDFGNSEIVNAVFENTSDTTKSNGFVLTRRLDQTQELWKVSSGAASTKQRILIDASDFSNIEFVGKRLLIESGKGAQQISVLDDTAIPFLKPLGLVVTNANAQVKSVGQNRIAVLDEAEGVSRLTVYKLDGDTVVTLGRRPFSSSVLAFDSSPDGNTLAVSTRDDFLVLDIGIGLPTRTILKDAVQPIVFDPSRDLLITGTKANTKSLVGWNTQNWMPSVSTQISESFELTGVSLHLSSSGRFLLASKDGQAFQNDLANGPLVSAVVTQNGTTQVQIGVRLPSR